MIIVRIYYDHSRNILRFMLNIRSQLEKDLLTYFFLNQEQKLYLNEIARLLKHNPANLDKKLKQLEKNGVFKSEWSGKQKYYFLNKKFALFQEYKNIINKTFGVENQIKILLKKVKKIDQIFLFGSYAKGNFDQWSDLDLLIIGEHDPLLLSKIISELEKKLARNINIVEMNPNEFKNRQNQNDPFLKEIFTHKILKLL